MTHCWECGSHVDFLGTVTNKLLNKPFLTVGQSIIIDRQLLMTATQKEGELVLVLNKGPGGSGWLTGKRMGSAREHRQRKVPIYFSRQDTFWLEDSFLPRDSYVMFIK